MAEPLVSAIVLAYDCERYLGAAIESVLTQTHPRMELVVIDNGSSDASREVAESYTPAIKVWIDPNRGICPARNTGLAVARGDYIGFLDGDDLWDARKTELQLDAFAADPGLDFVLAWAEQFISPELSEEKASRLQAPQEARPARVLGAMLAPRRTWDRVGPWTEELKLSEGLDWFLRAENAGMREAMLEQTVLRRRIHGNNVGLRAPEGRIEFARLLKGRLDQRRRGQS